MANITLYVLILTVVIVHRVKGNILSFIFLLFSCLSYDPIIFLSGYNEITWVLIKNTLYRYYVRINFFNKKRNML